MSTRVAFVSHVGRRGGGAERSLALVLEHAPPEIECIAIVFEDDGSGRIFKKIAGYHQFHAVRVAVGETLRAAKLAFRTEVRERGDRRQRYAASCGR